MSEKESADPVIRFKGNVSHFLKNNVERARQIKHPADGTHWPKKED